jgi:Zn-dependent protease with chaperone function
MDFFGAQARARRDSRLLGWAFAACVAAVVLGIGAVVLLAARIAAAGGRPRQGLQGSLGDWVILHPGIAAFTALVIAGFICGASWWRMRQLRAGGGHVARSVGGVRVERSTQDPRRRMLHNVVEEMAIASGVPLPEVYVLEQEDGINAFAAGHTPANAAVAVTRGALQKLNREQLQGVIAHEFSHVLNGDMRISIRLMGMIFGLMAVTAVGRTMLRFARHTGGRRDSGRAVAVVLLIGAALAIIGYLGWLMARVLQAWLSRRRESLADASAVQFTRNPEGLTQALVRVAAMGEARHYASAGLDQMAHMLFSHGARSLFATHPPMLERLQALEPSMTQERLESLKRQARKSWEAAAAAEASAADDAGASRNTAQGTGSGPAAMATLAEPESVPVAMPAAASVPVPAAAAIIAATTGDPAPRHLEQAIAVRRALPASLRASAEDPAEAQAILLATVIFADHAVRDRRLEFLSSRLGEEVTGRVAQLAGVSASLAPLLRLPAVLQLIPALRALAPEQRLRLVETLRSLPRLGGGLTVFEYALEKLAVRALLAQQRPVNPHGNLTLADCDGDLGVLFAVLARCGATDAARARLAYEAGIAPLLPRHRPAFAILEDWVPLLDRSLDRLCKLRVAGKQLLIEGLVRTIAHDGLLAPQEAELLRAICAVLECPLPPVLPAA